MLDGVVGERTLGAFTPVFGTSFDIGESTGVVGDRGDFTEKFDIRDLFDVALCGLSRDVLGSDGVFWKRGNSQVQYKMGKRHLNFFSNKFHHLRTADIVRVVQIERHRGSDAEVTLTLPDSGFCPSRGRRWRRLHVLPQRMVLRYDVPDFRQHGRRGAREIIQGRHVLMKVRYGGGGDGGKFRPGQFDHRRFRRFRHPLRLEADFGILDRAEHVTFHVVHHRGGTSHALNQVGGDQFLG